MTPRADGRAARVASALVAPGLAVALLAVPGVRDGLGRAGGGLLQADELGAGDLRPVAVQLPGTGRRAQPGWGTTVSAGLPPVTVSSGTIGRQPRTASDGQRVRPVPLPPPPPPAPPWAVRPSVAARTQAQVPPVELGAVRRLTRTVAAGEGVPLPAGTGIAHVLCSGPGAPRATYWLDDSSGRTMVHRADGSGTYDLWYRWTSRSYPGREACPS